MALLRQSSHNGTPELSPHSALSSNPSINGSETPNSSTHQTAGFGINRFSAQSKPVNSSSSPLNNSSFDKQQHAYSFSISPRRQKLKLLRNSVVFSDPFYLNASTLDLFKNNTSIVSDRIITKWQNTHVSLSQEKSLLFFRVAFDPLNNNIESLQKHGNDTKQTDPANQFSVENIKWIGTFFKTIHEIPCFNGIELDFSQCGTSFEFLNTFETILNEVVSVTTFAVVLSLRLSKAQFNILSQSPAQPQNTDTTLDTTTNLLNNPHDELRSAQNFFNELMAEYLSCLHVSDDYLDLPMVKKTSPFDAGKSPLSKTSIEPLPEIPNFFIVPKLPLSVATNSSILYCSNLICYKPEYHVDLEKADHLKKILQNTRNYSTPALFHDTSSYPHNSNFKDIHNSYMTSISRPISPVDWQLHSFKEPDSSKLNGLKSGEKDLSLSTSSTCVAKGSLDSLAMLDSKLPKYIDSPQVSTPYSKPASPSPFNLTLNTHSTSPAGNFNMASSLHSSNLNSFNFYNMYSKSDLTLHKVSQIQTALEDNKSQTYQGAKDPLSRVNSPIPRRNFGLNYNSFSELRQTGLSSLANGVSSDVDISRLGNEQQWASSIDQHGFHGKDFREDGFLKMRQPLAMSNSMHIELGSSNAGELASIGQKGIDTPGEMNSQFPTTYHWQNTSNHHRVPHLSADTQAKLSVIILTSTWVIVIVGLGSMFGLWKLLLGYDSSAVRFVVSYEKQTGYPISEYYACLIFMCFFVAWVWCLVSWMGMKFYRHTKGGIASSE